MSERLCVVVAADVSAGFTCIFGISGLGARRVYIGFYEIVSGESGFFVMRYRTAYAADRDDIAFFGTSRGRDDLRIFVFRGSLFGMVAPFAQTFPVATREVAFVEMSESGRRDGLDCIAAYGADAFGIRAFRAGGFEFLRNERVFRFRYVVDVFYGAAGAFEHGIAFFRARGSDDRRNRMIVFLIRGFVIRATFANAMPFATTEVGVQNVP